MSRHADEGRAKLLQTDRQQPRRLRRVDDQRHPPRAAERRDFLQRQDIAEDIRHMRADHRLRIGRDGGFKGGEGIRRVKQPASGDDHLRPDMVQGADDRVVLKAGDHGAAAGPHQRLDCKIERVRGVHGEHDLLRLGSKQLCREHAAVIDGVRGPHGGHVGPAAGRSHAAQGALHMVGHHRRLLERGGSGVKIDHSAASSRYPFGCIRYAPETGLFHARSSCAAWTPSSPPTYSAHVQPRPEISGGARRSWARRPDSYRIRRPDCAAVWLRNVKR